MAGTPIRMSKIKQVLRMRQQGFPNRRISRELGLYSCSKYNPIEHRLFAHITRSWNGAPLLSLKDAAKRAARITTESGLIEESYQKRVALKIVFYEQLPKWNYLIKQP